jgi:hypothetical protein
MNGSAPQALEFVQFRFTLFGRHVPSMFFRQRCRLRWWSALDRRESRGLSASSMSRAFLISVMSHLSMKFTKV